MERRVFSIYTLLIFALVAGCGGVGPAPPSLNTLAAPTHLSAIPAGENATLIWQDQSSNETGFDVERRVNEGVFAKLATVPANSTTYTDSTVTPNTSFAYRVRALRGKDASSYSEEVAYNSSTLEPADDFLVFSALGTNSTIGFSSQVFVGTVLNATISTSFDTGGELPGGIVAFGPKTTITVPQANIDLSAVDSATGAEIVVVAHTTEVVPPGATTFALVMVETADEPWVLRLPYDPRYPEFPVEIRAAHLRLVEEERGLTDPVRIHVYPVYEALEEAAGQMTPLVARQDTGLFRLSLNTNYGRYRDACAKRIDFWPEMPVDGAEDLGGKTPLVLVHGWQTLVNSIMGVRVHLPYGEFTPQICNWINFLEAYALEEDLEEKYAVYTFSYDSDDRVANNARELKDDLKEAFPNASAVVVAHSMGGLVASAAKRMFPNATPIDYIITLGTPYGGSRAITCVRTSSDLCEVAHVNPEIRFPLTVETFGVGPLAETALLPTLARPGTKDLAFEQGLGDHCEWSIGIGNPQVAGMLMQCEKIPNPDNPFLASLNRNTPPSPDNHYAIVGNIDENASSGPGLIVWFYDAINSALNGAYESNSDGIVTVDSGTFSSLLPHSTYPRAHHSALAGRDPSDNLSDPLPEVFSRLRAVASVVRPNVPTALAATLDPAVLYLVELDVAGQDILIGPIEEGLAELEITDIARCPDGTLYGISFYALYRIDSNSGEAIHIGDLTQDGYSPNPNSLACRSDGVLFAGAGTNAFSSGELLSIDRQTGAPSFIGDTGTGGFAGDMAFAQSGALYTVVHDSYTEALAQIDIETGTATVVGATSFDSIFGLAFAADTLYGLTTDTYGTGQLIRIDKQTGQGSFVRELAFSASGGAGFSLQRLNEEQ